MALGLPKDTRGQVLALIIIASLAGGYFFYAKVHGPKNDEIAADKAEIDSLQAIVDKAKADLASGTVDDLRKKVTQYQGDLDVMRTLVPDQNELPTLLDQISTKSKERGVSVAEFTPLAPEPGSPFDTYKYRLDIIGHYDQIGEFMADIASLKRIVVPQELQLTAASTQAQHLLGDTLGSLLEAQFSVRTYVKAAAPPPSKKPGGAGAKH